MTDIQLQSVDVGTLEPHPWQVNIPDLDGADWGEFLADIQRRGVQDPIRVSYRKGYPVVVDGHQRRRAALELDIDRLPCIIQDFADEAGEVEYLVGAARHRRNLTPAQKVRIAMKYKEQFAPEAKAAQGTRNDITQNFAESQPRQNRETNARAAAAVGLSRETFRQGEAIIQDAPQSVVTAWEQGEVATHVAYELTRKAPDPVRQALNEQRVDVMTAAAIMKDPALKQGIESGAKTVDETVSFLHVAREERRRSDEETGASLNHKMTRLLTAIRDVSRDDWDAVHNSPFNHQLGGTFRREWIEAAQHMLRLAEAGDVFTIDAAPLMTLDVN